MSKDKNKFMPVLRFPEFMKAGEWFECSIDSIGNVVTGGTPSKEDKDFWGGDFVWVTAQDFKEKYIYNSVLKLTQKGKDKSRIIPENSVLVTCIASIGLNGINKVECSTNQQINSIICNSKNHFEFIYYAISQNNNRLKDLAGRTAVPIISKSVFEKFIIHTPETLGEQQKIASCLSSLDEVITAHNQKLSTLKDHKKGLMQNLFPQEGETVPKYRFPEFLGDGEWVAKKLGDKEVSYFVNEKTSVNKLNIDSYISTENMIPEFSGVSTSSKLPSLGSFTKFKNGDILISNIRPYLKKVWKADKNGGASNDVLVFRSGSEVLSEFLERIIKNEAFINYVMESAKGVKMPRGDKDSMQKYIVFIPSKTEQQKIAFCLSALDDLITAQAEKIEQLNLHKKGLMQGLFPKIDN
jgi:type I restriction enzyme S subunit